MGGKNPPPPPSGVKPAGFGSKPARLPSLTTVEPADLGKPGEECLDISARVIAWLNTDLSDAYADVDALTMEL